MATPHVVGAAALYLADHPSVTPRQVRDALVSGGTRGRVGNAGSGSPNVLLYTGSGTTVPPTYSAVTSSATVAIPDAGAAATSTVNVARCAGTASATTPVEVHIEHGYRGGLVIDLLAADGSAYRLKNASNDVGDDIDQTYTVNASTETANGTWTSRVRDLYRYDSGSLTDWTLTV